MNIQTVITVFAVAVVFFIWYHQRKFRGKVLCSFRRKDKTLIEKLVPIKGGYVKFDGGKYELDTSRISLFWYEKGISQFFPHWVQHLDFSWDSPYPHDPENFQNTWDNPETRSSSEQTETFNAFAKGVDRQMGIKSRFPEWLFPAIMIGAIAIIGYLVYQQGQHLSYLEQLIKLGMQ